MADAVELVFKFSTQGEERLAAAEQNVKKALNGLSEGARKAEGFGAAMRGAGDATTQSGRAFLAFGDSLRSSVSSPLEFAEKALRGLTSGFALAAAGAVATAGAVALGARGIATFVQGYAEAAEATTNFADRLNIATGRAEQLQAMARMAGVNVGALESSARLLSAALEDPAGSGRKAVETLRQLGVSTFEATGAKREMGQVLLESLEKLNKVGSASERVALAQALLGRSGAVELIPLIKQYGELEQAVRRAGVGMDEALIAKLADVNSKFGQLSENWAQFKRNLAEPFIGPVGSGLDFLNRMFEREPGRFIDIDAINRNREGAEFERRFGIKQRSFLDFVRGRTPPAPAGPNFEALYLGSTQRGAQIRLRRLQEELAEQEQLIFSGAGAAIKGKAVDRANELFKEIRDLEKQIADFGKEKPAVPDTFAARRAALFGSILTPVDAPLGTLSRPGSAARLPAILEGAKEYNDAVKLLADAADDVNQSLTKRLGVEAAEFSDMTLELRALNREFELAGLRSRAMIEAEIRIAELGNNQYENARRIRDLRLQGARDEIEALQANLDYQVRLAEIEKQRTEQYREQARGVFRALLQGGGGLNALARTTGTQLIEQVFVNASGEMFKNFGRSLGRLGEKSGLGALLKDTLFDPQNAATETNTFATNRNTAALEVLTQAVASAGGGATVDGLGDVSGAEAATGGGTSRWRRALGIGGAAAGGAIGIIAGIRQGGARGAMTAVGSGAGAAAGILMAAGVSGPAAPILLGVGMGVMMIRALLGDPRQRFAEEQERVLASRRFSGPAAQERFADMAISAESFDTDFRGRTRVQRQVTINVNINALDMESLEARREDLAKVIGDAARAGDPNMVLAINQLVYGAA